MEKGVLAAMVATIEHGRHFIDSGIARRGEMIARKEARSGGKKVRLRANADDMWKLRNTDETSHLPPPSPLRQGPLRRY
jgi:hypothetical protein